MLAYKKLRWTFNAFAENYYELHIYLLSKFLDKMPCELHVPIAT